MSTKKIESVYYFEDGTVNLFTENPEKIDKEVVPGTYECDITESGISIYKYEQKERIEPLKSKQSDTIFSYINAFCKEGVRESINNAGFTHKLGILLHGKQGTGKTTLVNYIIRESVKSMNAICFNVENISSLKASIALAEMIRRKQDNLIIFMMDEFEGMAQSHESGVKKFLDGGDSIDNSISLACTNYLDKIPQTISKRPSRFRIIEEVGPPSLKDVTPVVEELCEKLDMSKEETSKILSECEGMTIDEIKSWILDMKMGQELKITDRGIGFSTREEEEEESCPSVTTLLFGTTKYYESEGLGTSGKIVGKANN